MRWFEYHVQKGYLDVRNPVMKNRSYRVSLLPEDVHTIVFWSKNYRPFLKSKISYSKNYNFYFNFSLVDCAEMELNAPPLSERLQQVKELCRRWSPEHINWRFDPILFWHEGQKNNLNSFYPIADFMGEMGIRRCTFSFVTPYNKVKKRTGEFDQQLYDPPLQQKLDVLANLSEFAKSRGIVLESCCDGQVLGVNGIVRGRCIHGPLLSALAGERASLANDKSQRQDCGCSKSSDIGSYDMSCPHACTYCYAKPVFSKIKSTIV